MMDLFTKIFTENIKFNPIFDIKIVGIASIIAIIFILIKPSGLFSVIRNILIVILLFVINLRIMVPNGKTVSLSQNLDVIIAVDTTLSMAAEDYNGTGIRMDAVKNDLKLITSELSGSKFSVISFDNQSKKLTPFTYDVNITNSAIDLLEPIYSTNANGTNLTEPINDIKDCIEASNNSNEERTLVLFYISDGEISTTDDLALFSSLNGSIKGGAILGYGTTTGGKMKAYINQYYNANINQKYVIDSTTKKEAISKINETNLKGIANNIGIDYVYMDKQSNIYDALTEIKNLSKYEFKENDLDYYDDTYYIFVIPVLFLIALDFLSFKRSMR